MANHRLQDVSKIYFSEFVAVAYWHHESLVVLQNLRTWIHFVLKFAHSPFVYQTSEESAGDEGADVVLVQRKNKPDRPPAHIFTRGLSQVQAFTPEKAGASEHRFERKGNNKKQICRKF